MVKVSIIMGIYNCALTLSEAIESILNQTFQDFELIFHIKRVMYCIA